MKKAVLLSFVLLSLLGGCGQHKQEHDGHLQDMEEGKGNDALYDEVMKIHDEVMPKKEDIMVLKESLKKRLEGLEPSQQALKKEIESTLALLDSADQSMMDWMHRFNPPADSLGEEGIREYLESEMEKIKTVKENILDALEKAKGLDQRP